MKRAVLLLLIAGLVVAPLAASAPVHAQTGNSTPENNTTVQELRERLQEANETIERLRNQKNPQIDEAKSDLDNLNGIPIELKTKIQSQPSLSGKLAKLKVYLQEGGSFPPAQLKDLKENGAWHPDKDEPAFLLLRVQEPGERDATKKYGLFQFCGEGFGSIDFNDDGQKAWCRIPIEQAGDTKIGPVRIDLLYAPDGMNRTYEFSQANAQTEIEELAGKLNSPRGFTAYTEWVEGKRNEAGTMRGGVWIVLAFLGIGLVYTSMKVEQSTGLMANRSAWLLSRQQGAALDRVRHSRIEDVPIVGAIIRKIRQWRRGR